ncbi:hypothetical protein HU200_001378 [Digitaria exilis]|uniref:Uncharacterized protein n=1 Tax=Digitaria exilis TaxID=1010633 RepID=A0A835G083_9POAL|nr:hypothetical protein HU200_001378 [Digitaria exilis]
MLLNPASEAFGAGQPSGSHLLEEPAAEMAGPAAFPGDRSFGSLVADQWSGSLPFRTDDADDMGRVRRAPRRLRPTAGSPTAPSRR